jgi:hypothetical protein
MDFYTRSDTPPRDHLAEVTFRKIANRGNTILPKANT